MAPLETMPARLRPSLNRRRARRSWAAVLLWAALVALGPACEDEGPPPPKAMPGEKPGTVRYIVYLEGEGPDLTAYRAARAADEDTGEIEEELRAAARKRIRSMRKELKKLGAKVVEVWYLTHAVTVELPSGNVPTLETLNGVERIAPDQLYQ